MNKLATLTILLAFGAFSFAFINTDDNRNESETDRVSTWDIDESHSELSFSVRHFFTPVRGLFENYHADIRFDPEDLENSQVDVQISVESINTRNERRDNHLRSDDFFHIENWPTISFVSNSIEQTGENTFVAKGTLTIKDISRNFELPFELLGVMDHPMHDNTQVAGIVSQTTLDRTDFNVGVGNWAETAIVGAEVTIDLNLELTSEN